MKLERARGERMNPTPTTLHIGYGSGEAALDREKLHQYRRLAAIHAGTDIGQRYLNRASECAARLRAWDNRA